MGITSTFRATLDVSLACPSIATVLLANSLNLSSPSNPSFYSSSFFHVTRRNYLRNYLQRRDYSHTVRPGPATQQPHARLHGSVRLQRFLDELQQVSLFIPTVNVQTLFPLCVDLHANANQRKLGLEAVTEEASGTTVISLPAHNASVTLAHATTTITTQGNEPLRRQLRDLVVAHLTLF